MDRVRVSDPVPDPVGSGAFACFGSGSGSGFQISSDPGTKKECRKGSKSYVLEENFKIMTKGRQKNDSGNNF